MIHLRKYKILIYSLLGVVVFLLALIFNTYYSSVKVKSHLSRHEFLKAWYDHNVEDNADIKEGKNLQNLFAKILPEYMNSLKIVMKSTESMTVFDSSRIFRNEDQAFTQTLILPGKVKVPLRFDKATSIDHKADAWIKKVFSNVSDHLISGELKIDQPELQFQDYSVKLLKTIDSIAAYSVNKNFPSLNPYRVYLAMDDKSSDEWGLLIYPAANRTYSGLEKGFERRPWWLAHIKDKFPSSYKQQKIEQSGITYTYEDEENGVDVFLVRTFWFKSEVAFYEKDTNISNSYDIVLCLDFLLNTTINESNKQDGLWASIVANDLILSLILAAGFLVVLVALTETALKRPFENIIIRIFGLGNTGRFKHFKLRRQDLREYVRNTRKTMTLQRELSTTRENMAQTEILNSWALKSKLGVDVQIRTGQKNTRKQVNIHKWEIEKFFQLDLRKEWLTRAIEIWQILDAENDDTEVGLIEINWQNTVRRRTDIMLDWIHWENEIANSNIRLLIAKSLENHLEKSEKPDFKISLDTNPDKADIPQIPEELRNTNLFKKLESKGKDFSKRKILIKEFDEFSELYQSEVFAICSIHFLKLLEKEENFSKILLGENVVNRVLIEKESNEFKDYYNNLENEKLKKVIDESLIVLPHNKAHTEVVSRHDFAVIKRNEKPVYVLYNFDDRTEDAGWLSWREVDKIYYSELYDFINDEGHTLLKPSEV